MEITGRTTFGPDPSSGWSVVLGERVLRLADSLGLAPQWRHLGFGRPSRRGSGRRAARAT